MKPLVVIAILASLGMTGCVDNAVLELEVLLPALPPPPVGETQQTVYAYLQARDGEVGFDTPWSGADPVDGFLLSTEARQETISIVANPENYTHDVNVRLRYCSNDTCTGLGAAGRPGDDQAGEAQLVIEHPFYSLKRTFVSWEPRLVEAMTIMPYRVMRCEVEGCRDGDSTSFCRMEDSTHFCESGP